ncbi:MAG: acyloxyacyl hydrolase [Acidobacteria bacterium]|nr:acyloxyacyl hydrolase [Acidobacteriota bacterium]
MTVLVWLVICYPGTGASAQDAAADRQVQGAVERAAPPEVAVAPASGEGRAQYPAFLANAFVNVNIGYINYPFSDLQLEPGHRAESVRVPHASVRAVLFGRHFGRYLSGQVSYMRPVEYAQYLNVDGADNSRSAWMHFGTLSLLARAPLGPRLSLFGEGGLAVTSRRGFADGADVVVNDAQFWSPLVGAGLEYRVNDTWDLVSSATYIPPSDEHRQPHTVFASAGFRINVRPLPAERVRKTLDAGRIVPENLIQVGYATNALGYGANNVLSKQVPIFWRGKVEVEHSVVNVQYHRNVFYTKRIFALDFGASYGQWTSDRNGDTFHTFSVFPVMRFTVVRSRPADFYALYSVAGPTYISRTVIDGLDTGSHFTFQDFMGIGVFLGARRQFNAEINLNHYSNGNIQLENAGVKVPLTFKVGYGF